MHPSDLSQGNTHGDGNANATNIPVAQEALSHSWRPLTYAAVRTWLPLQNVEHHKSSWVWNSFYFANSSDKPGWEFKIRKKKVEH